VVPAPALQCFPLTSLQLQPPATSQVTVFFSHTTPAPAFSSSLPNRVIGVQVKTVYHMDITVAILVSKYDYMSTTAVQSVVIDTVFKIFELYKLLLRISNAVNDGN